jgi:hypothetical protein
VTICLKIATIFCVFGHVRCGGNFIILSNSAGDLEIALIEPETDVLKIQNFDNRKEYGSTAIINICLALILCTYLLSPSVKIF